MVAVEVGRTGQSPYLFSTLRQHDFLMDGREEGKRRVKGKSEVFSLNDWNGGIALNRNRGDCM